MKENYGFFTCDMMHHAHSQTRNALLSCENLKAAHSGRLLYHHVGFSLMEGACMVISGDNGSGKSTMLRQIAGIAPQYGECIWFDTMIKSAADYDRDMVYIGDKHGLYDTFTVSEQLHFFAKHYGNTLLIDATIHYLEFEPYLNINVSALSAGWKRRLALSRLLLIPSLLWLLDEPMMHLDAHSTTLLGGLIQSHCEKGGACIMTMPYMDINPVIYDTPITLLHMHDFISDEEPY